MTDYEKNILLSYSLSDKDLVLGNFINTSIKESISNINSFLKNPYQGLYDWIQDEEVEIEAMIEAIKSYNDLFIKKENLISKKMNVEEVIRDLLSGKKNIKTMFSFKSSAEDLIEQENLKKSLENDIVSIEKLIKIASFAMEESIIWFKNEKLKGYYDVLLRFNNIQSENNKLSNELMSDIKEEVMLKIKN